MQRVLLLDKRNFLGLNLGVLLLDGDAEQLRLEARERVTEKFNSVTRGAVSRVRFISQSVSGAVAGEEEYAEGVLPVGGLVTAL